MRVYNICAHILNTYEGRERECMCVYVCVCLCIRVGECVRRYDGMIIHIASVYNILSVYMIFVF